MRKFASNTVIFYSKPLYKQLLDDELVLRRPHYPSGPDLDTRLAS